MSHNRSFGAVFPNRVGDWSIKNKESVYKVGAWSHKKVIWNCPKGHEYTSQVNHISAGQGCGVCSNKQVLAGVNDLATTHPHIAQDWHPTKNELTPTQVTFGSGKKVWWTCQKRHEWMASVTGRTDKDFGCTVCSGQSVMVGVNDLATINPELASQWHPKRNDSTPKDFTANSKKRVWWLGACGHEWQADIGSRNSRGNGCSYCSGNRVLPGFNDLATLSPHAVEKWDFSKNGGLKPADVSPGSHRKVHWTDKCGHSWFAAIRHVAQKGYGCAVCAGKRGGFDNNTLAKSEPTIAAEWHPDNDKTPEEVTRVSGYRAKWICEKGHEFTVRVCDRVNYRTGCARCSMSSESSTEKELYRFVKSLGVNAIENDRSVVPSYEADVYCPDQKVAIEFNGIYWHSEKFRGKSYHADKTDAFQEEGVQVIHVWEDEWRDSRGAVERMIARKLGVSKERSLNARSLQVKPATVGESREFLEENHIQGYVPASVQLALWESGSVVALITFRKRGAGKWELARYATSANVRGGFTKLLKAFIRQENPSEVVTFADRLVSDGSLYRNSGFHKDGELPPDYKYVRNGVKREHKFNYRKARFKNDPKLKYREGATERELAGMNNLHRLYDAGKVRWVWRP